MEVRPVLQVLVGKTIEQALLEVLEEEELANLRAQQQTFKEIRDAELVEVQRLEERERRLRVEKVGITTSHTQLDAQPKNTKVVVLIKSEVKTMATEIWATKQYCCLEILAQFSCWLLTVSCIVA